MPALNYLLRPVTTLALLTALSGLAGAAEPTVVPLSINGRVPEVAEAARLVEGHLLLSGAVLAAELGVTLESANGGGAWVLRTYGHQLSLRPGDTRYWLEREERRAPIAPQFWGDDLFIPVQMLAQPLGLEVTRGDTWRLQTPAAQVLSVRQGVHPEKVRFVVDLTGPVHFRWEEEAGKVMVEFPAAADREGRQRVMRLHTFDDALAPQVTEILDNGLVRLIFAHDSSRPATVFTLTGPPRIVVDLMRGNAVPAATVKPPPEIPVLPPTPRPTDPWRVQTFSGAKGPVRGFSLQVDLRNGYTWKPALAAPTIMRRAGVTRIARENDAFAALNGGFFSALGPPLGLLVVDGEWVKAPLYGRTVLGLTRDGQCAIRRAGFSGRVEFADLGSLPLEGLNQGHVDPDGVVAYTSRWGSVVEGAVGRTRLVVGPEGKVVNAYMNGEPAAIPPGGFVVSGYGRRATTLAGVCVGTPVRLCLDTDPPWPGLWQAIGGGPTLVREGQIHLTAAEERFRSDVTNGSRPRSAVGLTAEGQMLLLAVQEPGVTLRELAGLMQKLGAREAMNLDGGGSTALVVQGRLLNTPGDGCERAVSNALLVLTQKGAGGGPEPLPEE